MSRLKLNYFLVFLLLFQFNKVIGQISCEKLTETVKSGVLYHEINPLILNSSWLNNVDWYYIEGKFFVVAIIKDRNFQKHEYVFCNIPKKNYQEFYFGANDPPHSTYGERFHKYIIDYKCDCY